MPSIEIRITAIAAAGSQLKFEESNGFFIDAFSPISAAGILNQLRDMSAIKKYVYEHDIPANPDRLPTIISPLNDQGEFSISLPSPESANQIFVIKMIDYS